LFLFFRYLSLSISKVEEKKERKESDAQPSAATISTDEIKMESNPV